MGLSTCSGHSSLCGEVKLKDQYELYVDPMITPRKGENMKNFQVDRQRESRKLVIQLINEQGVEVEDMSDKQIKKMEGLVQDLFVR